MKKKILYFFTIIFLISCSKDSAINNKNPYLPNYPVDLTINLNLPEYNNLQFVSNSVYINNGAAGVRGIFVFNAGSNNYVAFDAACPNQALSSCSTMTINGIKAVCACDDAEYSFFTGQAPNKQYPMKQYRVQQVNGTTLRVYN
ncbi:hypothetical protein FIA58_019935 [Flavobacterium jejuense]|uniref:Rieske domain-containing protein n=1 Tax=Flavobacterium jejuense TaxID=1544455 RepID=A0ABX0IXH5_9FLAO|nr:hypothetical protein [Flavobacterium jejuense]NHN27955.1 hypothetical protein [Flavobacterium jejuense]